jgi:hypothetical protein
MVFSTTSVLFIPPPPRPLQVSVPDQLHFIRLVNQIVPANVIPARHTLTRANTQMACDTYRTGGAKRSDGTRGSWMRSEEKTDCRVPLAQTTLSLKAYSGTHSEETGRQIQSSDKAQYLCIARVTPGFGCELVERPGLGVCLLR